MAEQNTATAVSVKVKINGTEVEDTYLVAFSVEQDLGQPDMCAVTLRNEDHKFSGKYKPGDSIVICTGDKDAKVFIGEVVGIEPVYRANGENVVVYRGFNLLHRLLHGRKSKTFVKQSDKDVVGAIAGANGLSPKCGSDAGSIKHEHLYQHNQTDLEFLRLRAARLGYDVWVDDKTLYFDAPDPAKDSGIKCRYGDAGASSEAGQVFLKSFRPRLSAANVVKEVTVRGWDPEKKEEIVGTEKAASSRLGSKNAVSGSSGIPIASVTYRVDHPIFSVEEAKAIAKAKVTEHSFSYIVGEGEIRGTPEVKPGVVITVTVNPDDSGDRFNGKYMITGTTHSYSHTKVGDTGGYITGFRCTRDAEGG